jgi:hypothetical protein
MKVFNTALLSVSMLLVSALPVMAQDALNSSGALTPTQHTDNRGSNINYVPWGQNGGVQGWADTTSTNGARGPMSPNGPLLYGSGSGPSGQSGAATSAPFQGTYAAPANFALRNEGRMTLPPTQLTSIVRDSGMNDQVFGDEGTDGPPPYDDFSYLINGVSATTGHQSDAPSAWGYPQ